MMSDLEKSRYLENLRKEVEQMVADTETGGRKAIEQMVAWFKESGLPYEMTYVGGWAVPKPKLRLFVVVGEGTLMAAQEQAKDATD